MSEPAPKRGGGPAGQPGLDPDEILVVRRGPGANCSSIGSALDVLFLSAVAGGAILAGVAAAFPRAEPRAPSAPRDPAPDPDAAPDPRPAAPDDDAEREPPDARAT